MTTEMEELPEILYNKFNRELEKSEDTNLIAKFINALKKIEIVVFTIKDTIKK